MMRPRLLQLCPLTHALERRLDEHFTVTRWDPQTVPDDWLARHGNDVRAVVTNGQIGCPSELIVRLPALGIIAIHGVGHDRVDLALARARGVRVTITPDVLTADVADLAIGLVIAVLRGVTRADAHVRCGGWSTGKPPLGRRMTGRSFGLVGMGRIGQAIAARLQAFGPVLYTGPHAKPVPQAYVSDLIGLARQVDVLIVASNATAANRHMIDAAVLEALGPEGYLINVARGALVDEAALVAALAAGRLAGAGLDVFADEPHVPAALLAMPQVVLTPHIGSSTTEARAAMAGCVIASLEAFLAGIPVPGLVD